MRTVFLLRLCVILIVSISVFGEARSQNPLLVHEFGGSLFAQTGVPGNYEPEDWFRSIKQSNYQPDFWSDTLYSDGFDTRLFGFYFNTGFQFHTYLAPARQLEKGKGLLPAFKFALGFMTEERAVDLGQYYFDDSLFINNLVSMEQRVTIINAQVAAIIRTNDRKGVFLETGLSLHLGASIRSRMDISSLYEVSRQIGFSAPESLFRESNYENLPSRNVLIATALLPISLNIKLANNFFMYLEYALGIRLTHVINAYSYRNGVGTFSFGVRIIR